MVCNIIYIYISEQEIICPNSITVNNPDGFLCRQNCPARIAAMKLARLSIIAAQRDRHRFLEAFFPSKLDGEIEALHSLVLSQCLNQEIR